MNPFTADALDGLDYAALVAAWAAVAVRWSGPDTGLIKFNAREVEYGAIVARLEVLAATDPRVVERVQRAANRHIGGHLPGDAEGGMCLAACRAAVYPTTTGFGSRGPFASIHHSPGDPRDRP